MAGRALIIGCGYVGRPLARRMRTENWRVDGWVHSEEGAAALDREVFSGVIVGSVADEVVWRQSEVGHDLVIHCASSGRGGVEAYTEVFLRGMQQIVAHLPNARKLLVSSTSVYGQTGGEVVDEASPAKPASATSLVLRDAEQAALEAGAIVVRSAGIYGPDRAVLFEKLRRGEAVIEGDGSRWMNQIHRHDLVEALLHLAVLGGRSEIYNAADDSPVTHHDYYRWCAEFLRVPLPPVGPVNTARKRGLTNKRVSNAKLRASGWTPLYPSFREGLAADYSPR